MPYLHTGFRIYLYRSTSLRIDRMEFTQAANIFFQILCLFSLCSFGYEHYHIQIFLFFNIWYLDIAYANRYRLVSFVCRINMGRFILIQFDSLLLGPVVNFVDWSFDICILPLPGFSASSLSTATIVMLSVNVTIVACRNSAISLLYSK